MSLLPPQFLKSVVLIKADKTCGTGFIIAVQDGEKTQKGTPHSLFLVTNRHVVLNRKKVEIRIDSKTKVLDIDFKGHETSFVYPTNTKIDLAISRISPSYLEAIKSEYEPILERDMIFEKDDFRENIHVGQEVFLLGFPLGITGVNKNYPIARQGIIARNDEELLENGQVLLDINNFPGNSGGPIFLKPSAIALNGRKPVKQAKLIGLVCACINSPRELFDNSTNPPTPKMVLEENSGIAIAVPIHLAYGIAQDIIEEDKKKEEDVKKKIKNQVKKS